jgi:acetyl esterase/lipase
VLSHFKHSLLEHHRENLKLYAHRLDVDYGSHKLDLWANDEQLLESEPDETVRLVVIHFHGGYWRFGDRTDGSSLVPLVLRGEEPTVFASVGYDYASAEWSVAQIARDQALLAVDYLSKRFPTAEMVLCGHSAGAQIAAKGE